MKKIKLLFTLITALLSACTVLVPTGIVLVWATQTTRHVPDDYLTIQEAIDASDPGDTIFVAPGIYYEHISITKRNLTIIGQDGYSTTIDGNQTSSVIFLNTRDVTIRHFKIQNGAFGINMVQAKNCTITNNVLTNHTDEAIRISWQSSDNTIANNSLIANPGYGIRNMLHSDINVISNNTISGNKYGISIANSIHTTLHNNTLTDNTYNFGVQGSSIQEFTHTIDASNTINGKTTIYLTNQIDLVINPTTYPDTGYLAVIDSRNITIGNFSISHNIQGILLVNTTHSSIEGMNLLNNLLGIEFIHSELNDVRRSKIESHGVEETAVRLLRAKFNTITNNRIDTNHKGLNLIDYSTNNTITGNTISNNWYGMYVQVYSSGNTIYHNNFINNTDQVSNSWSNSTWDIGYPSGGNYWSDYTGDDHDGDGIGDTPYIIDESNRDNYPLINPTGEQPTDTAVTNVTLSDTGAYAGEIICIAVVVENEGTFTESFNVSVRYENVTLGISGTVGAQEVLDLAPGGSVELMISWNTAVVPPCVLYTIIAEASTLPGEVDTVDNIYVDGTVKVKLPGDINGDGAVDVFDLSIVAAAYGNRIGQPNYNPDADLNEDGIVDLRDLAVICGNYGSSCP